MAQPRKARASIFIRTERTLASLACMNGPRRSQLAGDNVDDADRPLGEYPGALSVWYNAWPSQKQIRVSFQADQVTRRKCEHDYVVTLEDAIINHTIPELLTSTLVAKVRAGSSFDELPESPSTMKRADDAATSCLSTSSRSVESSRKEDVHPSPRIPTYCRGGGGGRGEVGVSVKHYLGGTLSCRHPRTKSWHWQQRTSR